MLFECHLLSLAYHLNHLDDPQDMKRNLLLTLLLSSIAISACKKSEETSTESTTTANTTSEQTNVATSSEPPAKSAVESTEADKEIAAKQKLMDYASMEDTYMNDPKAQWATTASASSTFGDEEGKTPADSNLASNMTAKVDSKTWNNNNQDIGFDWIELGYGKPVAATEVRLVMPNGNAPESLSKVELQDTDGKWNTVWSGISETKNDDRGNRTWFVKSFPKTAYQVKAVKYTFANNISHGYKQVDAAQLIGE